MGHTVRPDGTINTGTSQHTPGPWIVVEDGGDLAIEVKNKRVARIGADSDGSYIADARLIAAAPELLEALKNLVSNDLIKDTIDGEEGRIKALRIILTAEGK